MPLTLGLVAAGSKVASGGLQLLQGGKIHPQWHQYSANPYAAQQLGSAQMAYNGRMAGAQSAEQNIANAQSNNQANANRNATDSAQALALGQMGQGQANAGYTDLATKEGQNKQALLGNLNQAYGVNINEGDKVYNSMLQKYQMDAQAKAALNSSGLKNIVGGLSDAATSAYLDSQGDPTTLPNLPPMTVPRLPIGMLQYQQQSNAYPTYP